MRVDTARVRMDRRHRTLDERLLLRVPALAHSTFGLGSRLPPGSRLRNRLTVHWVSAAASAVNRRDFDVLFIGFDPSIDFRVVSAGTGGVVVPDLIGHHYGYAGYLHVWHTMLAQFPDLTLEPVEVHDFQDRWFSVTLMRGHGSASGIPVEQFLFQVFTLRHGLVVKQEDFATREEAEAALGARLEATAR